MCIHAGATKQGNTSLLPPYNPTVGHSLGNPDFIDKYWWASTFDALLLLKMCFHKA